MRALAVSFVIHALVAWWLWRPHRASVSVQPPVRAADQAPPVDEAPIEVAMLDEPAPRGGGGGPRAAIRAASPGAPVHADARAEMTIGMDAPASGDGAAAGGGGNGRGHGIGFGDGGGIATTASVPAPPAPPPPSRARPAKLLRPSRDREVLDDDYLFVARVTVDEEGDVAAVRMITTHPGMRGETAASAIWSFHYAPALDDAGLPIRSTFEQPFQIR